MSLECCELHGFWPGHSGCCARAFNRQVRATLLSLPAVAAQPVKIPASHTKVKKPGQGYSHSCYRVTVSPGTGSQSIGCTQVPRHSRLFFFFQVALQSRREYPYPRGQLPSSHREQRAMSAQVSLRRDRRRYPGIEEVASEPVLPRHHPLRLWDR